MVIKSHENSVGAWAFLIGVILAIIVGLSTTLLPFQWITEYTTQIYAILVLLGVIIGFMNVTGKDTPTFLIAGMSLVIVSKFGMDSVEGSLIGLEIGKIAIATFGALLVLFVPATIIVALKTVFSTANV